MAEKRSSLSPQELADVDEPLNINADPAISIERKIKANRNHMYLFYGSKDDAIVEECVRLANRDVRISLTSVIDEPKAKEFTHDLRLPTYAAMQDDYIVKALLIILAPVFMLYGLGLVAS